MSRAKVAWIVFVAVCALGTWMAWRDLGQPL